jgi:hypothetical protein
MKTGADYYFDRTGSASDILLMLNGAPRRTLPKSLGVKEGVMLSLKSGNDQQDSGALCQRKLSTTCRPNKMI